MPKGPGKYDAECMQALLSTRARCVVLFVVDGDRGHGFSVNTTDPEIVKALPRLLRESADIIEGVS